MAHKSRPSDERRAVPSFLRGLGRAQSSGDSGASQAGGWGAWQALDSASNAADSVALSVTSAGFRGTDDAQPFEFSLDDVTLRSGVAVMEYVPTSRRLPPPVTDADLAHLLMHGSLRLGGRVDLWTSKYVGYTICAICLSLTAAMVDSTVQWLRPHELGLDNFRELGGLIHLQWAVVLPIGLLSDALAPLGYHRKSFMIIGWGIMAVVWAAYFVVFQFRASIFGGDMPPSALDLSLACIGMIALTIVRIPLEARFLELAQQEELSTRGGVVGTYLIISLFPRLMIRLLLLLQQTLSASAPSMLSLYSSSSSSGSHRNSGGHERLEFVLPIPVVAVILMLIALLPIPFLVFCAQETQKASSSSRSLLSASRWHGIIKHIGDAFRRVWCAVHQKAVSDIVIMNTALCFFGRLEYPGASIAVSRWSGETVEYSMARGAVMDVSTLLVAILWKRQLLSSSWLKCLISAVLISKLGSITNTLIVLVGPVHEPWMPTVGAIFLAPGFVVVTLAGMIPTLEVVQAGSEAGVYALILSTQLLMEILGRQIIQAIETTGALVAPEKLNDSTSTASSVAIGSAVVIAVSLISILSACFLPRQRQQAQQRRLLAGYSSPRRLAIAIGFALLYPLVAALQLARHAPANRAEYAIYR